MNYNVRLNLQKISGAFLLNIQGNAEKKRCLCIPVDEAGLFIGEKGVYLNLMGFALKEQKDSRTHLVKQALPKEIYENLSEEAKKAQPILGDFVEVKPKEQPITRTYDVSGKTSNDDLPF